MPEAAVAYTVTSLPASTKLKFFTQSSGPLKLRQFHSSQVLRIWILCGGVQDRHPQVREQRVPERKLVGGGQSSIWLKIINLRFSKSKTANITNDLRMENKAVSHRQMKPETPALRYPTEAGILPQQRTFSMKSPVFCLITKSLVRLRTCDHLFCIFQCDNEKIIF